MDGVTYIADHTKKEEESTRVSFDGFPESKVSFKSLLL